MSLISSNISKCSSQNSLLYSCSLASADPASVQNGFTHAFVLEFENKEDRNFYVKQDEAHLAFVATLEGLVNGAQVLDYTPGNY